MRENITKVAERGERLDSLQDKTDNLAISAQTFKRGANRVRKNMWWKDMKVHELLYYPGIQDFSYLILSIQMRIIIGAGIAIIIIIIVVSVVKSVKH